MLQWMRRTDGDPFVVWGLIADERRRLGWSASLMAMSLLMALYTPFRLLVRCLMVLRQYWPW